MRRHVRALCIAVMAAALPAVVQAALAWTLVAVPVTATQGQSTVFTLTATGLAGTLGCLQVDLPASFVIQSVGTPSASNGFPWVSSVSGNSVVAAATSDKGRLGTGQTAAFTITALSTSPGAFTWNDYGHTKWACNDSPIAGAPLAITVLPAPTPTPAPTASPTPTPSPTATPAPSPTATPGGTATAGPGTTATPAGTGSAGSISPSPTTAGPAATSQPSSSGTPSLTVAGGSGPDQLRVAPLDGSSGAGNDDLAAGLDLLSSLDSAFVWFVPGATVGVPGLLVLILIALQAVGALAWVPAVGRMGGTNERSGRVPTG